MAIQCSHGRILIIIYQASPSYTQINHTSDFGILSYVRQVFNWTENLLILH